jgi:phage-related protein
MVEIRFYVTDAQKMPVVENINKLSIKDKAKIFSVLSDLEKYDKEYCRAQFRIISGKLWEIKITISSGGYRIFYVTICKDVMVLLHSYQKKTQKAPLKELDLAKQRMKEVLRDENKYIK